MKSLSGLQCKMKPSHNCETLCEISTTVEFYKTISGNEKHVLLIGYILGVELNSCCSLLESAGEFQR